MPNPKTAVRHIKQSDRFGCALACVAMVVGCDYSEIRDAIGDPGTGITHHVWQEYLWQHGYAWQHVFAYDPIRRRLRSPWPLQPWAKFHICSVDAGLGQGSHCVVLLKDGTTFDPVRSDAGMLSDYPSVAYMTAVFPLNQEVESDADV